MARASPPLEPGGAGAESSAGDGSGQSGLFQPEATSAPESPRLHRLANRLETLTALDAPAGRLASLVRRLIRPGRLKDLVSGSWLGHPVHPLLSDAALSAWLSAALLDAWGGRASERAAERLVGAGAVVALPTALTGLTDWADTSAGPRRVGLVHAAANSVALTLYSASYLMRRLGRRRRGLRLGFAGAGALLVGAYLGGHLSYSRGIGVNRTAFEEPLLDWTPVLDESSLPEGQPTRARAGGLDLLILRRGDEAFALSNRCTHRGGYLHDGKLEGLNVTCPLHGSTFRMSDGAVLRGPASAPEPAYEVRLRNGKVELRVQAEMRKRA